MLYNVKKHIKWQQIITRLKILQCPISNKEFFSEMHYGTLQGPPNKPFVILKNKEHTRNLQGIVIKDVMK